MQKSRRSGHQRKDAQQTKRKGTVDGYYFDGTKSYTIYHKENRSYLVQDK